MRIATLLRAFVVFSLSFPALIKGAPLEVANNAAYAATTGLNRILLSPINSYSKSSSLSSVLGPGLLELTSDASATVGPVQISEPTIKASGVVFSNVTETSMTISWTNGNGSSRIVLCRESTLLANANPVDGVSYSHNSNYQLAPGIGSNKVVYNGSGNSFTMTGLTLNKPYTIGIMEYNGTGSSTNYRSDFTFGFQQTPGAAPEPTLVSTNVTIQVVSAPEYAVKISWTSGNGEGRVVMVREGQNYVSAPPTDGFQYPANNNYQTAPVSGPNRVVYNGSGNSFVLKGISPDQWYGVAIFEYNGAGHPINYMTQKASGTVGTSSIQKIYDNLTFQYRYDQRQRMIAKKVPGADWVYMVYDARDRLVMTQDGVQRNKREWSITKYDALNRPVLTGIYTSPTVLDQEQMAANISTSTLSEAYTGGISTHGYSNVVFPTSNVAYSTVTYYDNYDFLQGWHREHEYKPTDISPVTINGVEYMQPAHPLMRVIGQVTGTKTCVLDGAISNGHYWLSTVNYFDEKYRVIQSVSDNYIGGIDRVTNVYDFVGKVLKTKTTHYGLNFKDLVGIQYRNGKINKTGSNEAWGNSGAASREILPAGEDGWVEITAASTNKAMMIGFSQSNPDAGWNSIDHALYLTNLGTIQVREKGSSDLLGSSPTYAIGDVFRIERKQGRMYYYKNGIRLLDRPANSNPLIIDLSIHGALGQFYNVRSSLGSHHPQIIERRFDYDHTGRLVNLWHHRGNESEILLAHNEYNELGQLVDKKLHSSNTSAEDAKQSLDYRYNIRGWLTSMNNSSLSQDDLLNDDSGDLFGFELGYDKDIGLGNEAMFNGNISGMKWSRYGEIATPESGYTYSYDPMSRIKSANFKQKRTAWNTPVDSQFSETGYEYDLNGNLTRLIRYDHRGSVSPMDNLTYDYGPVKSNQLLKVSDSGDDEAGFKELNSPGYDYAYDANGNMIFDNNKGQSAIKNGEFDEGDSHWVSTGGGFVFSDGSVSKVDNTVANRIDQLNVIKPGAKYIVVVDLVRNSSTGSASVAIGGTGASLAPGMNTFIIVAGTGRDVRLSFTGSFLGKVNKIEVRSTLAISYNRLNLPQFVYQGNSHLQYIYDANGRKLSQELFEGTLVKKKSVYAGDFYYENDTLKIINHEEGRIIPEIDGSVYQYHLKDHLGNVRLTFTTKEDITVDRATMETVNESEEQGAFLYYDEAIKVNHEIFDRTYNGTTGATYYATRLTGANTNAVFGLAKSLSVMPGDVVKTEVYAKYLDTNTTNWTTALQSFIASIAAGTAPPGTVVDGGASGSLGGGTFPVETINHSSETGTAPKAYLNWIVFNKDMTQVVEQGFYRITTNSREYGQNCAHDRLFKDLTIKEPGYVYLYLSNENETIVEVFFDDFRVEHIKSPVVQMDDYYPFGLTFNSYSRENSTPNKFKFQGQEHIDDLNLGWDSFKWRNHDPAIGRFFNIDPLADKYVYNSPYAFSENHVVAHRELEGLEKVLAIYYHGGPTGGGQQTTPEKAGTTGDIFNSTQSYAQSEGREFAGTIIAPGLTSASGVETGLEFFNANYTEGDQVVIYGYSYGVDVAMDLATKLGEMGVLVNTLVTVDGSDGPLQNSTVNTTVPDNVMSNLNIYQTNNSGSSSSSASTGATSSNSSSGSSSSNSGTSNFPGSNGGPNKPTANSKNKVITNKNVTGAGVTHGNIQQKEQETIQGHINERIRNYYIPIQ